MNIEDYLKLKKKKKSKYNATKIIKHEIKFHSKLEASYYDFLLTQIADKKVKYFLTQIPFRLDGGIKYIVDFQLFMADGQVRYVDIKGFMTDMSKLKIKQTIAKYPIEIELITKNDKFK